MIEPKMIFPVLLLITGVLAAQDEDENSCYGCHLELDPPFSTPAELFPGDIHVHEELSCTGCHGGDSEAWDYDEAKDPSTGFIGVPEGREIVEMCSKCHSQPEQMRRFNPTLPTDQAAKYWTSGHGKALAGGNLQAAQCISCHGVHKIKPSGDPGSPTYRVNVAATCEQCHADPEIVGPAGFSVLIPDQYRASVHGLAMERGDLAAPTCNSCHGNHGAAPPEVASIEQICGTCHPNNQRLFDASRMKTIFSDRGLHGCVVCHTAHQIRQAADAMIAMGPGEICSTCHVAGSPATEKVLEIRSVLDSLDDALTKAEHALAAAESQGLEVEEAYLDLQAARAAQVKSRTHVHAFDANAVSAEAIPGFEASASVLKAIERLVAEYSNRRIGLGIATILISFLAVTLYLYIRTLDET